MESYTEPLALHQLPNKGSQQQAKSTAESKMTVRLLEKSKRIERMLPDRTKRAVEHAKLKGASFWLNTMPVKEL